MNHEVKKNDDFFHRIAIYIAIIYGILRIGKNVSQLKKLALAHGKILNGSYKNFRRS